MAFDWEELEGAPAEDQGDAADLTAATPFWEAATQSEQAPAETVQLDEQVSEAEHRLQRAMLYRQFLSQRVFDGSDDAETRAVEAEFRAFARAKMQALLGVGPDPLPPGGGGASPFSGEEVAILKIVAGRALAAAKANAAPKPAPAEKKAAPALRPVKLAPAPPRKPAPVVAAAPPARPAPPRRAAPPPAAEPPPPGGVPKDGTVMTVKGRRYKIAWRQMNPAEYGEGSERKLAALPPKTALTLFNGVRVWKTEGDEYFKIIAQDLTTQARDVAAAPMPANMEAYSQMQAGESLTALNAHVSNTVSAVGGR